MIYNVPYHLQCFLKWDYLGRENREIRMPGKTAIPVVSVIQKLWARFRLTREQFRTMSG